ncbi:MAG: CBS domain-containing protein [Candidatus Bathyarchaeia archaeon]|nr:CBS domain-containing protein [Candidatus Bathyarchaeota archaeon A05DMB-4]MDH7595011.1 CBS domain-containing protein [Candidatus Bathyarchaeota archaeon]
MLVKDIMNSSWQALYEDELVTKARAIMREQGVRVLPIINNERRLLGVVSRSDVMAVTSSKSPIRVKGVMSTSWYVATTDAEAARTVQEMIKLDYWYAPVIKSVQDNVYAGVLGLENFIQALLKKESPKLMKPVSEIMTTDVITCSPEDEIDNVWRLMQEKSVRGLPVTERDKLVGIVTEKNLLESGADFPTFESRKGRFKAPAKIASLMKTSVTTLKKTATLKEAARIIVEKNFGRLPVVDDRGVLIGIVDREDIVKALL